jgi:hypothetical protein
VKKPRKPSSTESPLFLSIAPEPIPETLTAMGGVPLLVRAFRGLGLPASVREQVEVKQRELGLDEAEMNVVLADEFRDGNVPAMMDPLDVAKRSFAALPETVTTYYFRGDSACHECNLVDWPRDENRADRSRGR